MNWFKLSKFFLYTALCALVIVMSSTLFPFIVGKYVFFRAMVGVSAITFSLGLLFEDKKEEMWNRLKDVVRHPLSLALIIFGFVFVIAGFFGANPSASFWSNFERGEGGLQMLNLLAFFLLASVHLREWKDWKKFFIVWMSVAGIVILYGIGAGLGLGGAFIGSKFASGMRFAGSLGNAAYVGTYMLFTLVFALILAAKETNKKNKKWWYVCAIISFIFFWWSQTRGAFMGLAAGLVAAGIYFAFKKPNLRRTVLPGIGVIVVLIGIFISLSNTPFVKELPGARLFTISLEERTIQTRLWTWNSALQGFKDRPIFGWGPENFALVFDKYFDHRHFLPNEGSETWFDRAHSIYFDALAETGVVGFISLISLFIVYFAQFVKFSKGDTTHMSIFEKSLFIFIPIMYLVQGIVLFDVFPIYLSLFSFFAFTLWSFKSGEIKLGVKK